MPRATLYKGRLRDIQESAFDQFGHLTIEKRQQQRADVRAIDVSVRHDDDLVVTQFSMLNSSRPMPVPSAMTMLPIS